LGEVLNRCAKCFGFANIKEFEKKVSLFAMVYKDLQCLKFA